MEQYLGISMVVIVVGIVLAVLARLVTGGILDEIERIRNLRFTRRCKTIGNLIKDSSTYIEKYINNAKEAIKMYEQLGSKGQKYAKEAWDKTADEMLKDYKLK